MTQHVKTSYTDKTVETKKRFKLPHRTALISFEGTDYDGAEVKIKLDVPMSLFLQMETMINGQRTSLRHSGEWCC